MGGPAEHARKEDVLPQMCTVAGALALSTLVVKEFNISYHGRDIYQIIGFIDDGNLV